MLQLEYTCTNAEMREARLLYRRLLGKGSRFRKLLIVFGILAVLVVLAYFLIRPQVATKNTFWFLVLYAAVFAFFYFRAVNRSQKKLKFELSDKEVTTVRDDSRFSWPWSTFGDCLESSGLFVLPDKSKRYFLVFPKRAFPNEATQNWFRNLANQRSNESTADIPVSYDASATAQGIVLNYKLSYGDCLYRTLMSWRTKGAAILLYSIPFLMFFYWLVHPDPRPNVNSPTETIFAFALPSFTAILAVAIVFWSVVSWYFDTKILGNRQVILSAERLDFTTSKGRGFVPWTSFKYWLEDRRCFVIWNTFGSGCEMFPKRAFTSPSEVENCRRLLGN